MAVVHDAVGPAGGAGAAGTATALSWTHVMSASAGGCLTVWAAVGPQSGGDGGITTAATYSSVAMTSLGVSHTGGGTAGYVEGFILFNPAAGSNTVLVTRTGGSGTIDLLGCSESATGAGSNGTPVLSATAGSVASLNNVITSKTGDLTVSGGAAGEAFTAYNQTLDNRKTVNTLSGAANIQSGHAAGAASVTHTHTLAGADFIGAVGVNLLAAVSGGSTFPASPGQTWRRRFQHKQMLRPPLAAPSGVTYQGDAATVLTFTATSAAARTALVDATTSLTFTATANAAQTKLADAATVLTFTATADTTRTTLGQASAPLTFTATAQAATTMLPGASAVLTFSATADTAVTKLAQVSTTLTFGATADTTRTTLGQTTTALTFTATADATVQHAGVQADVTTALTFTATSAATRTTLGQTTTALTFSATADGALTKLAQASMVLTLTTTSAATRTTLGQTSSPLTLAFTAAATVTSGVTTTPGSMTTTPAPTSAMTLTPGPSAAMAGAQAAGPGMTTTPGPSAAMTSTDGPAPHMTGGQP